MQILLECGAQISLCSDNECSSEWCREVVARREFGEREGYQLVKLVKGHNDLP